MSGLKKIVAGAVVAAGGLALDFIGGAIFSATGEYTGPYVNYKSLIGLSSTGLLAIGGIIALAGIIEGVYSMVSGEEEEESSEEREGSRRRPSGNSPSSRRDRRNSPPRS